MDERAINKLREPGGRLNINMSSCLYREPHVEDKMDSDCLIFNMGIPIPRKDSLYIETGPRALLFPTSLIYFIKLELQNLPYSPHWTSNLEFGKYQWIRNIEINLLLSQKMPNIFWIGNFHKRTCSLSAWWISGHACKSTIIVHCTPKHGALFWLRAVSPIHIMVPSILPHSPPH